MDNNEAFHYSYSPQEREELEAIRSKYQPPQEDKLTRLRKLDASVTRKGTVLSLIAGVLGALLLGSGMSLIMTDLGADLGSTGALLLGLLLGCLGIAGVIAAYPLYRYCTTRERQRLAPQILKLAEELMGQ